MLDEVGAGSTNVTEVTSWMDVTTDPAFEEKSVLERATLKSAVAARRFLKIVIAVVGVWCWGK